MDAAPSGAESSVMPSFDNLLAASDSVFSVCDPRSGAVLYVSPNVQRIFDLQPAELIGCGATARSLRASRLAAAR